ncbi:DUF6517 family protein [Halobium salinum]|uniref:DUF6517 family protein n=1 Tax=Halobium salinum TaxID=1364940 RepID=A0ABD5PGD3_9EURY|nr:DUF6517 family protein [Halobium salinum]
MYATRPGAAALLFAALVVLAGCTGTLVNAEASPATIPTEAHEAVGYVHGNTTAVPLTYPIGVAGVSRDVTVTSYVSGYSKTVGATEGSPGDVAALLVVSTPNARVAGQSANPFAHATNAELTERAFALLDRAKALGGTEYEDLGDVRELAREERTVLGGSAEVVSFAATATVDGNPTEVRLHVVSVEHGDDVVVALGVHEVGFDESAALAGMMERIEHAAGEN